MPRNLRVHISPVGYEFLRISEPLIKMRADTVYLITYTKDNKKAKDYYNKILKELRQNYKHIKVEEVCINIWDLFDCLEKFREIINSDKGNQVYINVSTGTKITAIAGMMSCMLWNAIPYYAPVSYASTDDNTKPPSEFVDEAVILPVYEIKKPKPEHMLILNLLQQSGGKLRKSQVIKKLEKLEIIRLKDEKKTSLSEAAKHSQLRAILNPMENDWKYVKIYSAGRLSEVSITEQVETALKIFGFDESM